MSQTRLLYFILLIVSTTGFGQVLEKKMSIDTLEIIKCSPLPDQEIRYTTENGTFVFSKQLTAKEMENFINEWQGEIDTTRNVSKWKIESIAEYKEVLNYVKQNNPIILDDKWKASFDIELKQPELTASHLQDFACKMIETGDFKFIRNGNEVKSLVKVNVIETDMYSETSSINYLSTDSQLLWLCPPVIHSDFAD